MSVRSIVVPLAAALVALQPLAGAAAQPPRGVRAPLGLAVPRGATVLARPARDHQRIDDETHAAVLAAVRAKIKYVFVIYQENRSFDSYFGTFPGADGLFTQPRDGTPGFTQAITGVDGSQTRITPFRIGPKQYAADTDDVDHSHAALVDKMHVVNGVAAMDRFASVEEARHLRPGETPTLAAKQFAELSMAYADCDTVPLLWNYANRFTLFDHIFQSITGPSTPGNLALLGAQSGETQWLLHPEQAYEGNGNHGAGVPVLDDADPFWGSPSDPAQAKLPVNPGDFPRYETQRNLTYATLPLTLAGGTAASVAAADTARASDLGDVEDDVRALAASGAAAVPWGWYEEGYGREPGDPPGVASHASYVTHHDAPQYFGYIANNPQLARNLHALSDFRVDVGRGALPPGGGVYFVKGGYANQQGLRPSDPDPAVQRAFVGDDDHPAYADAQISEAMVARTINAIARSRYWPQSAIVLTWGDSEGSYDHVPPPPDQVGPSGQLITEGPRVPLLVISPYAKTHTVVSSHGSTGSVVKLIDEVFARTPLAKLPDEEHARSIGKALYLRNDLGPTDGPHDQTDDLLDAFDRDRLSGALDPLAPAYALVPDGYVDRLPAQSGLDCAGIGVVPVDRAKGIRTTIPADFNPRPRTNPTIVNLRPLLGAPPAGPPPPAPAGPPARPAGAATP